ncbi:hypothetical protein LTR99_008031 [Exophiala xenobiotica]|uniref:Ubiquitin-like domain-containing protein n=1 Tax=Vermiconidia calcicola TaxID=1690605 RepID=A0AAV9PTA6_9PEZI|nr:hypothetical protein LTR41_000615 [Exophiala xenobiotica]KAK5527808.1 hypothetical protein LTR25_010851 [Vermiconidia calcicola]KAK5528313.1 hypothetical protein LTR23_011079 [Chaetothyriales sp. CCFEE 6169]KAK5266034.1 hypothetical protein LTR96_008428 [Exophiala xenobiotica]KAK5297629.1 hypothetical protein LTR99_008031 [Exophiala xenobiotica]
MSTPMSLKVPTSSHLPAPDDDLDLTIRFSASLPDLLLTIPGSTNYANTATLKQLIRSRIPNEYAKHRIRLIYAGKALADDVPLKVSLKRTVSRPPSRIGTPGPYDDSYSRLNGAANKDKDKDNGKEGKGKVVVRDPPAQSRIYIHCSIGDIVLSAAEIAEEAATSQHGAGKSDNKEDNIAATAAQQTTTTTTPAPRGFDRLLNAGFTAAEVQSLRLQFLAIQAHTHTPDTMPSPNTLRNMEDRWLDNSNASADPGALDDGAGASFADDDGQVGALDDMIFGTAMGFFWPIGCLMWAVREEGIWSQRRKMAVVVGFMLNIGLGLVRYTG